MNQGQWRRLLVYLETLTRIQKKKKNKCWYSLDMASQWGKQLHEVFVKVK